MSYTLRGRIETRLAAALLPFAVAAVLSPILHVWWPLELMGVMLAVGLALDVLLYHRLLPYQPGWLAVPLGLLELGADDGRRAAARAERAALAGRRALRLRLARAPGACARGLAAAAAQLAGGRRRAGTARPHPRRRGSRSCCWRSSAPPGPSSRRPSGSRPACTRGRWSSTTRKRSIGEPGTIVRGGILITADDVTVRNVTVRGGEYGIEVDGADSVELDDVVVEGAELDGINVRRSQVEIRDCTIRSLPAAYTQGIDISFGFDLHPSIVERCTVTGGLEGIVTHFAMVMVRDNHISGTELRAITMTEMSMGMIEDNEVDGAVGVGIFCGDYSECEIEDNTISNVTPDAESDDETRRGVAIQAHRGAEAELKDNEISGSPGGVAAFVEATIHERR